MPVFNYSDYADDLRNVICSNPIANAVSAASSRCDAINMAARMSQNSRLSTIDDCIVMDVDSVRNTLAGMTRDATLRDLAVALDRQFRPAMSNAANSIETLLRNKKEDRRRRELEYIKRLISSKATIRYRIEVK